MAGKSTGWGEVPKDTQGITNYWDSKHTEISSIPSIAGASENVQGILAPPSAYVGHQVANLSALNQKLILPTKTEGGIDLSLLTSVVKPSDIVYEKDELWDYEHLIIEIAQIIRNQKDEPEKVAEELMSMDQADLMPFEENAF